MIKVLVVRVGEEPKVEEVNNPFSFAKNSLLDGGFVESNTLPDGVVIYCGEVFGKRIPYNRSVLAVAPRIPKNVTVIDMSQNSALPGTMGEHRIRGNFLLTRHDDDGGCSDLTQDDILRYSTMLQLPSAKERCKRCGEKVAYTGAVFCGAACSAQFEAGE